MSTPTESTASEPTATADPTDGEWVLPVGQRPGATLADRGFTRIGVVGGDHEVVVDPAGAISLDADAPLLDWWIAGDERWYFPSVEPTVTQSVVAGTTVVETRMRVPGGEVVHRCYAIQRSSTDGGGEAVVVEIENASALPFGVAFSVRPFSLTGATPVRQVALEGATLVADGRAVLTLARPANRAIAATGAHGDLATSVVAGAATDARFDPVACPAGRAQAALIVPVAHRTTYRALLPVGGPAPGSPAAAYPSVLPSTDQVIDGWKVQTRDLARATVPEERLAALIEAVGPTVSMAASSRLAQAGWSERADVGAPRWDHVAAVAGAFGDLGMVERSEILLARAAAFADVELPGARLDPGLDWLVVAFGEHLSRHPDATLAHALADSTVQIIGPIAARTANRRRRSTDSAAMLPVPGGDAAVLRAAAVVLSVAGRADAATDAADLASRADDGAHATPAGIATDVVQRALWARHAARNGDATQAWRTLDTLLDLGSPTRAWPATIPTELDPGQDVPRTDRHSVAAIAAIASLAWTLLVHEVDDRLRVLPAVPASWLGQPVEVHGVSTALGRTAFALRWHGARPALLWQIEDTATTRASGIDAAALDPTWHSHDLSGEALLEEVAGMEPVAPAGGVVISGLQIGRAKPRADG